VDEVTWAALTAVLTAIGAAWTWYAFRHRGAASGLRGAGLTLLPPAAWLTGTLEMFTEIGSAITDWATHIVLSPAVWAGIVLAGISVLLLGGSSMLRERERNRNASDSPRAATGGEQRQALGGSTPKNEPVIDEDLADIEAILKRRGIT
jgi:hypothetical protein